MINIQHHCGHFLCKLFDNLAAGNGGLMFFSITYSERKPLRIFDACLTLRLGGRKGIRPVKTEWCGAGVVFCLEQGADLHMAQLMPLPLTISCFSKIQIGFTFLVAAHLGSPGKKAVKRVCVLQVECFS